MRRADLDWLRVGLFGILVLHHTAVGFASFGAEIYGFANDRLAGPLLDLLVYWSHCWRLPTLFVIAGIATWFASAKAPPLAFAGRRFLRLVVPLVAGSLLLNPLAIWVILSMAGVPEPGIAAPRAWWEPPRFAMHLWFLYNLALYSVLLVPLYALRGRLRVPGPRMLLVGLAGMTALVSVLWKPWGAAVAGEGYQLGWYLVFVLGGFLIGARADAVLGWARRWMWALIALGLVLFLGEVVLIETTRASSDALAERLAGGGWAAEGLAPAYGLQGVSFAILESLGAWVWVMAALGLAGRLSPGEGPWLRRLSPAVFPVYVFHFPLTIIGLALVAQTPWPWGVDFILLAAGTYLGSWMLYIVLRRFGPVIWIFGGRPMAPGQA